MQSDMQSHARRPWTREEVATLIRMVERYGCARGRGAANIWGHISRHLPGRSNGDCRKKWFQGLDPAVRKGRWTEAEDNILLKTYCRLGPAWKDIAALIPGRKDDQCQKRYTEILDPAARGRLRSWTAEEDEYLTNQVLAVGRKWAVIAAGLSGRPPLTCRNRWRAIEGKNQKRGRASTRKASARESEMESDMSPQLPSIGLCSNSATSTTPNDDALNFSSTPSLAGYCSDPDPLETPISDLAFTLLSGEEDSAGIDWAQTLDPSLPSSELAMEGFDTDGLSSLDFGNGISGAMEPGGTYSQHDNVQSGGYVINDTGSNLENTLNNTASQLGISYGNLSAVPSVPLGQVTHHYHVYHHHHIYHHDFNGDTRRVRSTDSGWPVC